MCRPQSNAPALLMLHSGDIMKAGTLWSKGQCDHVGLYMVPQAAKVRVWRITLGMSWPQRHQIDASFFARTCRPDTAAPWPACGRALKDR